MSQGIIIAILAAVGGGAAAALINGLFQGPKTRAEAQKLIAEQGQTIDGRWEKLNDELEERLAAERQEHKDQIDQLRRSGVEMEEKHRKELVGLIERVSALEEKLVASEEQVASLRTQLDAERRVTARLRQELNAEKQVTREVIAWALAMRDEIQRLGGSLQDVPRRVEDYINLME